MNNLEQGFELVQQFISVAQVQILLNEITATHDQKSIHGLRNAEKKFTCIANLIRSDKVLAKAKAVLGKDPQLVRALLFDKTPDKNWLVAWHQDKTVSVNNKQYIEGWGPWTIKDGTHHVQPSEAVLNDMVTFRIHLDETNAQNGCLKVIPKSHSRGVLKQTDIDETIVQTEFIECEAKAGDMLIMKPLILHASSKAVSPYHRRVIHIEFSGYKLPDGMVWA